MAKKFTRHPSTHQVGRERPMAIELDRNNAKLGRYRKAYEDNAIYYYGVFQYMGGGFYRTILGYETIWDKRVEDEMNLCLDFYLTRLDDRKQYYIRDYEPVINHLVYGVRWNRGVAPTPLSFDMQWSYALKAGERLTARVNLLDTPHRVDIERHETAEVFTVPLIRFNNLKTRLWKEIKKEDARYETESTNETEGREGPGAEMVRRPCNQKSSRPLSAKLLHLCKGQRRKAQMQETPEGLRRCVLRNDKRVFRVF